MEYLNLVIITHRVWISNELNLLMKLIFFSLFLHQVYQVYYIVVSTYSSSIVFFLYRKTIKILFPKEVAERQHYQETLPDYRSVMSRFDALHIKPTQRSPSSHEVQHVRFSFSKIIFIVLSILGIAMVSAEIRFIMPP